MNTNLANTIGTGITATVSEIIQVGLANALAIESQNRGLYKTMGVMASVLNNPQYFILLPQDYQIIIINALSTFQYDLGTYGLTNYPILQAPSIVVGNVVPSPVVTVVPDFYAQIFYAPSVDPYPGYVQYQSIVDFSINIYTVRTINNPPFSEASDLFIYSAQQAFANNLDQYIVQANLSISALSSIITSVLNQTLANWHTAMLGTGSQNQALTTNTTVTTITSTSSSSFSSSASSLVAMLLPWLNSMIQGAQNNHLPKSVLNIGAIQQLLNNHGDQCAKMKMLQQYGQQAIQKGVGGTGPSSDYP